ncbi:MAG: hypothetical protein KH359_11695 [Clostridiales bacterium]|nr:hypothetical protein [Proteus hauseri]MBS6521267.1 hypothetical protein [Clostridiales bacterium]
MRKNMKKLGALACAGVLGLGVVGNPVMAANGQGQGETDVFYVTGSTNIDADGKVVMVIPADVNLNKNKTEGTMDLTIMTADGSEFVDNFSADVKVTSLNGGKLKSNGNPDVAYWLKGADSNKVDLSKESDVASFAQVQAPDQKLTSQTKVLTVGVEQQSVDELEKANAGTIYSDTLTFKVTNLKGYKAI